MFEHLAQFPVIVVSGPHRSGTTICGEIIAADLNYRPCREETFGWSDEQHFRECLQWDRVVLQAPFFAHIVHMVPQWTDPERVCVVFMRRPADEILASQARVMRDFGEGGGIAGYRMRQYHSHSPLPSVVYESWTDQRTRIPHWREIEYASLAAHPKWVDDRSLFHLRQTA